MTSNNIPEIMLSIHPQWIDLIKSVIGEQNGKPLYKKSYEVRKKRPKQDPPYRCFIYETKSRNNETYKRYKVDRITSGKVIGEFICDRIEEINVFENGSIQNWNALNLEDTCVPYYQLAYYVGHGNKGYAWHISDLQIYDKPRELSEFKKMGFMTEEEWLFNLYPNTHCHYEAWVERFEIKSPPQSWQFVREVRHE